jgi:hypothetical protein
MFGWNSKIYSVFKGLEEVEPGAVPGGWMKWGGQVDWYNATPFCPLQGPGQYERIGENVTLQNMNWTIQFWEQPNDAYREVYESFIRFMILMDHDCRAINSLAPDEYAKIFNLDTASGGVGIADNPGLKQYHVASINDDFVNTTSIRNPDGKRYTLLHDEIIKMVPRRATAPPNAIETVPSELVEGSIDLGGIICRSNDPTGDLRSWDRGIRMLAISESADDHVYWRGRCEVTYYG